MPSASCLPVFTTSLKKCLTTIVLSDVADFFLCWLSSQHSGDEIRTIGIEIRVNSEHCWLERKDKPGGKETVNLYADSIGGQAIKKGNKPGNEKVYNNATAFCFGSFSCCQELLIQEICWSFRYSCIVFGLLMIWSSQEVNICFEIFQADKIFRRCLFTFWKSSFLSLLGKDFLVRVMQGAVWQDFRH